MTGSRNSDHGSAAHAGRCSTNPYLRRNLDCADTLKLALRVCGRLLHTPHSCGGISDADVLTGLPQHKPIAAAES